MTSPALVHGWFSDATASALLTGTVAAAAAWTVVAVAFSIHTALEGERERAAALLLLTPVFVVGAVLAVGVPIALVERYGLGTPLVVVVAALIAIRSDYLESGGIGLVVTALYSPVVALAAVGVGALEYGVRLAIDRSALYSLLPGAAELPGGTEAVTAALAPAVVALVPLVVALAAFADPPRLGGRSADEWLAGPGVYLVVVLAAAPVVVGLLWSLVALWLVTPVVVLLTWYAPLEPYDREPTERPDAVDDGADDAAASGASDQEVVRVSGPMRRLGAAREALLVGIVSPLGLVVLAPALEVAARLGLRPVLGASFATQTSMVPAASLPLARRQAAWLAVAAGLASAAALLLIAGARWLSPPDGIERARERVPTLASVALWSLAFGSVVTVPTALFVGDGLWSPLAAFPLLLAPIAGFALVDPSHRVSRRLGVLAVGLVATLAAGGLEYVFRSVVG